MPPNKRQGLLRKCSKPCFHLNIQFSSVGGNGNHLPWNEFSAGLKCFFRSQFDAAAAWYFHTYDGHALNIVGSDNLRQLLTVVHRIQLRTANQCDTVFDEFLMEIAISIGTAVCSNEQVSTVEIRCIYRSQLNLDRPIGKLRWTSCRCRRS